MRKIFSCLANVIIFLLIKGCCEDCSDNCAQTPDAYEFYFICYVYDKSTNETIVGRGLTCPYSNELSALVNQSGDTLRIGGTINSLGKMVFPLIIRGRDSTDYLIKQEYYLHLVDFNGIERDIDTLRFSFTLINSERCEKYDFKDFRCYYNDSLYLTEYKWYKEGGRVFFYN